MRTLYLLRHAKSSWDDSRLSDHDRPLAPRGRRAAPAMGRYMATEGLVPERVLCSTAARTRETWALIAPTLGDLPSVEFDEELYLATASRLLAVVRGVPDTVGSLLLVGHNPGTEVLASALAGSGSSSELERLRRKFPTGALAVLACGAEHWSEIGYGQCRLDRFVRPADLADSGGT